ncbi:hypothetical protein [Lysinibacillus antri]|uniref:DUF1659 domain-containing protein n=1 Tax=Lysinibacillus antri TaxID=2498145 RepID=A0A3S0R4T1_9BACI|nr:hypothetical protein [Lysinibacillus antri]RUL48797.1 hypothetical protein EK386_16295 [Lysinibacillus antri]
MASYLTSKTNFIFEFEVGMENGKPKKKRVTLSGVRNDITADEANQVIDGISNLIKYNLTGFERVVYEGVIQ